MCEEHKTQRDDQIARPRRAQACERSELRAMRMFPLSGQIFFSVFVEHDVDLNNGLEVVRGLYKLRNRPSDTVQADVSHR